jgi:hypothetical protein
VCSFVTKAEGLFLCSHDAEKRRCITRDQDNNIIIVLDIVIILRSLKHKVSKAGFVSVIRCNGAEILTQLRPLERGSLNN